MEIPKRAGLTLKKRIAKSVGANTLGQFVSVLIHLFGLPLYLSIWNVEEYGSWLLLNSFASVLSMSDIGFASAAANDMAMKVSNNDKKGAIQTYQTMLVLLSLIGGVVFTLIVVAFWLFRIADYLPLESISPFTASAVLTILTAHTIAGQQIGVFQAGFYCDGNYALGQILGTSFRLLEFLAQVGCAAITKSMELTALSALFVRVASIGIYYLTLRRYSRWLHYGTKMANPGIARALLIPAFAFLGMPLAYAILNQGMLYIIASTLGSASVVVFVAHRTLANFGIQGITIVNRAVRPELSSAIGAGNFESARKLNLQMCQTTIIFTLFITTLTAVVAKPIFQFWTNNEITASYWVLSPLLVVVVLRSTWLSSYVVPSATNKHAGITVLFVLASSLSLLVCSLIISNSQLFGVGLSLVITELIMGAVVFRVSMRILNESVSDFLRELFYMKSATQQ